MKIAVLATMFVAVLVAAAPAAAGCWATVGIAPPPPGIGAGQVWNAELTVLQHGRNPLPDAASARPTVTIVNSETGERRTFAAEPTAPAEGRYAASVVFPTDGSWSYRVSDGFTTMDGEPVPCERTHTFSPVEIAGGGAGAGGGDGGSSPPWALVGALTALGAFGLAAAVVAGLRRRRVASPAPARAEVA